MESLKHLDKLHKVVDEHELSLISGGRKKRGYGKFRNWFSKYASPSLNALGEIAEAASDIWRR